MTSSHRNSMPLVDQEGHGNDEPPDVRFAIDDDDDVGGAYDAGDGDDNGQSSIRQQEEQERQPLHPQGRSSQDGWSGHVPAEEEASYKYPPAAPPPSYREATGKSLITHHVSKLCSSVSLPDLSILQRGISRIWIIICRFWPTSRFAQVGLFMMGLWLLVIVSGPVFDDAGPRAGAGYPWAGIDKLSENGPGPISGDGHIVAHANWTLKSCRNSRAHRGEVLCTSTTRIELDSPTDFKSNEDLFIFADPPRRDHLTDGRGRLPGTIEFLLVEEGSAPNQSPRGKVSVIVDANYEQSRGEVFERTTVGKMAARFTSQGVGIYTYPLPSKYSKRYPPPMYMNIKVLVPAGAVIPALRAEASGMTIGAFIEPEAMHAPRHNKRSLPLGRKEMSLQRRAPLPAPAPAPVTKLAAPYFGRFVLTTATSSIRSGHVVPLNAMGVVRFMSYNGDVVVGSDINTTEVRFESMTGNVRIDDGAQIIAYREAHLASQTGNIELRPRSSLFSTVTIASTQNGGILGGAEVDAGIWRTNRTVELKTSNGAVHAAVGVHKVTQRNWNPGNLVRVEAESKNGNVDVRVVDQDAGPTLHSNVISNVGASSARMHPSFVGSWELEGSRGSSSATPPPAGDPRHFVRTEHKESPMTLLDKGTIGSDGAATKGAAPDASHVTVRSSLGAAKLAFT